MRPFVMVTFALLSASPVLAQDPTSSATAPSPGDAGTAPETETPGLSFAPIVSEPSPSAGDGVATQEAEAPSLSFEPIAPAPDASGASSPSSALGPPVPDRFFVSARLGYAFPFGEFSRQLTSSSTRLTEVMEGVIPLQVDAAYRFNRLVQAGLYAQYGQAAVQQTCVGECIGANLRAGVQVLFHPPNGTRWDFFIGPELGFDATNFSAAVFGAPAMAYSYRGLDAGLTAGIDHPIADRLRLGFYLSGRVGVYQWLTVRAAAEGSETIPAQALHGFLGGGVRLQYAVF